MHSYGAFRDSYRCVFEEIQTQDGIFSEKQNPFLVDIPFFSGYNKIENTITFKKERK